MNTLQNLRIKDVCLQKKKRRRSSDSIHKTLVIWTTNDYLKTSRTPVDKANRSSWFDTANGCVDIPRSHIPAEEDRTGHEEAVAGVALHHLIGRLEAHVGQLGRGQSLVVRLLRGDERSIRDQRKVNSGKGHQIGLPLGQRCVEGAFKSQGRRDGTDHLERIHKVPY